MWLVVFLYFGYAATVLWSASSLASSSSWSWFCLLRWTGWCGRCRRRFTTFRKVRRSEVSNKTYFSSCYHFILRVNTYTLQTISTYTYVITMYLRTYPAKVKSVDTSRFATWSKTLPFLTARNSLIASSWESPWRLVPLIAKISSPVPKAD